MNKNGEIEEGIYKNDLENGAFVYIYSDGTKENSFFVNGTREGDFTITYKNGIVSTGKYVKGTKKVLVQLNIQMAKLKM